MKVVIIGNGVAGVTCAMAIRRRDPDAVVTIVGKETSHFFSRTALMYAFMDRMKRRDLEPYERDVYLAQRIDLVHDSVENLSAAEGNVTLKSGRTLFYDRLVLATGAVPHLFPWQGLELEAQKHLGASDQALGLVHFVSMNDLDVCEALVPTTKEAVVVGGGLIGIELVESLLHQGIKVTFLIREPFFWPMSLCAAEAEVVKAEMVRHGVNVVCEDEIQKISKNTDGRISAIVTKKGLNIPCQMLGVCTGVKPNTRSISGMDPKLKVRRGFLVNQRLETSLTHVYAAGDCAEILLPNAKGEVDFENPGQSFNELIWYSAKRQGAFVANAVFGDKTVYVPPLFFNSSKFFEIEFTTVGTVQKDGLNNPSLLLTSQAGARGLHSKRPATLRIVHNSECVLGFNVLGARVDHEVFENWIHERRSLEFCLANLRKAQFDVEFGRVPFEKFVSTTLMPEAI